MGRSSRSRNKNWLRHGLSEEEGQGGSVRATGGEKGKDPALRLDRAADTEGTRRGPAEGRPLLPGRGRRPADIRGGRRPGYGRSRGAPGGRGRGAGTGAGVAPLERRPLAGLWVRTRRGEQTPGLRRSAGSAAAAAATSQPGPLLPLPLAVSPRLYGDRIRPLAPPPPSLWSPLPPSAPLRAGMGDVLVTHALGPPPPGAGARSAARNASGPSLNPKVTQIFNLDSLLP